jgi:hypothetical protein
MESTVQAFHARRNAHELAVHNSDTCIELTEIFEMYLVYISSRSNWGKLLRPEERTKVFELFQSVSLSSCGLVLKVFQVDVENAIAEIPKFTSFL